MVTNTGQDSSVKRSKSMAESARFEQLDAVQASGLRVSHCRSTGLLGNQIQNNGFYRTSLILVMVADFRRRG
jgi:hypothetical protein